MKPSRSQPRPIPQRSLPSVACECIDCRVGERGDAQRGLAARRRALLTVGTPKVAAVGGALVVVPPPGSGVGLLAIAQAMSHSGEIVQGCLKVQGRETTVLISLPDPTRHSTATCWTTPGSGHVHIAAGFVKARTAAILVMTRARLHDHDLHFYLSSTITEGVGAGRSSADCQAVIRAASAALDLHLLDTEVIGIDCEAERAADPLATFSWGVTPIWGSRTGQIVEVIHARLPPLLCVAAIADPTRTVSTTEQAQNTSYEAYEIDAFRKILGRARRAILAGDAAALVRAGADSLELGQRRCQTPHLEAIRRIAQGAGALGVLGSHSGVVVVVAFDALAEGLQQRADGAAQALRLLGCADVHTFLTSTGGPR